MDEGEITDKFNPVALTLDETSANMELKNPLFFVDEEKQDVQFKYPNTAESLNNGHSKYVVLNDTTIYPISSKSESFGKLIYKCILSTLYLLGIIEVARKTE